MLQDSAFFTAEVVKQELGTDERIDGMIDRAIKRLVQAKAMKQLLGPHVPIVGSDQSKEFPGSEPRSKKLSIKNRGVE